MNLANARSFGDASKPCVDDASCIVRSQVKLLRNVKRFVAAVGTAGHRDHRAKCELEQATRCGWSAPSWMQPPRRVLQRCG